MNEPRLIPQDLASYRRLFPITADAVYFNHAGTGPMSLPAKRVIEECLAVYQHRGDFDFETYSDKLTEARRNVARLIGADFEEIVFTPNTSEGIYIAVVNLPLKDGDKIIIMDEVFPAVRYLVDYNLPHIEKEYVRFCGVDPLEVMKKYLDKKVRAVVIDFVQFFTGEMIDLMRLADFLKDKGIYLIVDGIQGVGTVDFDVKKTAIDFLACGASKWLFGPSGTGFLYINKKNFKSLKRLHTGWLGADWQGFENFELQPPLFEDARMFEAGTRNLIGITAFSENCKMLLDYGLENVNARIWGLKKRLRQQFEELNYEILTPLGNLQSGIMTVRPRYDPQKLFKLLKEKRIIISLRNNCLRFSPHFYNTDEEIDRVFEILKSQ